MIVPILLVGLKRQDGAMSYLTRGAFQPPFEGGYVAYSPDRRDASIGHEWCRRSRTRRRLGLGVLFVAGGVTLLVLDRRRPQEVQADDG